MNAHNYYSEHLPLYAAGQLSSGARAEFSRHLETCAECRADLEIWQAVRTEVTDASSVVQAPSGLEGRALDRIHAPSPFQRALLSTYNLLRIQVYLVRHEMWPSSAVLMFIGVAATFMAQKVILLQSVAPLVAAASLTLLFGPENDPACELTLATPTAPWKVLLARLALVHGYNLALTLVASLVLLLILPADLLWTYILGWLGPMTFLPALALLLSLWTGSNNSIAIVYGLWLLQFIKPIWLPPSLANLLAPVINAYRQFWSQPTLLIVAGLLLIMGACWSAGRVSPRLVHSPV